MSLKLISLIALWLGCLITGMGAACAARAADETLVDEVVRAEQDYRAELGSAGRKNMAADRAKVYVKHFESVHQLAEAEHEQAKRTIKSFTENLKRRFKDMLSSRPVAETAGTPKQAVAVATKIAQPSSVSKPGALEVKAGGADTVSFRQDPQAVPTKSADGVGPKSGAGGADAVSFRK